MHLCARKAEHHAHEGGESDEHDGVPVLRLLDPARETFWLTGGVLFWQGTILAAVLLVLTRWVKQTKNWHPIVFIGLTALVGVVFRFAGA